MSAQGRLIPIPSDAMPILPPEPDSYPPDLWEDGASVAGEDEALWWCLHTKPRQEKATARDLRRAGVAYYLPQARKESHTPQGRRIESVVPLFTSYMFMKGSSRDRLTALRANRLVGILEVADQDALARDLRQIHTMINSGLVVTEEPTVPVGATVRIASGPLTGVVGKVIRRANGDHLVAVVHFLGRGATVLLEDWQVERVTE
jgi:transcriptional antiterminator RfaH